MQIHGKEYIEVKDRVKEFHSNYPNGYITTEIIKNEGNPWRKAKGIDCSDLKRAWRSWTGKCTSVSHHESKA